MARCALTGPFVLRHPGHGWWEMTAINSDSTSVRMPTTLLLKLAGTAPTLVNGSRFDAVVIEWRARDVAVTVVGAAGERHFKADLAVLHNAIGKFTNCRNLDSKKC